MSIERCEHHSYHWDSDKMEQCPLCLELYTQALAEEDYTLMMEGPAYDPTT